MSIFLFIIGFLICYYGIVVRMEWLMFKKQGLENQNKEIKSPLKESSDEFDFLMKDVDEELQNNALTNAFSRKDSRSKMNKKRPFTIIKNKKSKSI